MQLYCRDIFAQMPCKSCTTITRIYFQCLETGLRGSGGWVKRRAPPSTREALASHCSLPVVGGSRAHQPNRNNQSIDQSINQPNRSTTCPFALSLELDPCPTNFSPPSSPLCGPVLRSISRFPSHAETPYQAEVAHTLRDWLGVFFGPSAGLIWHSHQPRRSLLCKRKTR